MKYITFFCMIFLCTFSLHSQAGSGTDLSDEITLEVAKADLITPNSARCVVRVANNSSSQLTNVVVSNELASGEVLKRIMRILDEDISEEGITIDKCRLEINSQLSNATTTCNDGVIMAWENGKIICTAPAIKPNGGVLILYFDIEYTTLIEDCTCSLNCDQMTAEKTISQAEIFNKVNYEASSRRHDDGCLPGMYCDPWGSSPNFCDCNDCHSHNECEYGIYNSCFPPYYETCLCDVEYYNSTRTCDDTHNNECTEESGFCDGNGNCVTSPLPSGTPCTDDGNECTNDVCDASGTCARLNEPSGTPCTDDGNECTNDICDGSGICTHPHEINGESCVSAGGTVHSDCFSQMCLNGVCGHTVIGGCCLADIDCYNLNDGCTEGYCDNTGPNNPVCSTKAKICNIDADCTVPCGLITDAFSTNLFCDNGECASSPKENRCDADSERLCSFE